MLNISVAFLFNQLIFKLSVWVG